MVLGLEIPFAGFNELDGALILMDLPLLVSDLLVGSLELSCQPLVFLGMLLKPGFEFSLFFFELLDLQVAEFIRFRLGQVLHLARFCICVYVERLV